MKVNLPKNGYKPSPILPLVSENANKYISKEKLRTFELYTNPSDTTSAKYKTTIQVLDGTEDLRVTLKWFQDMQRILKGMAITAGTNQVTIIQELLRGSSLTAFNTALEATAAEIRELAADEAYAAAAGDNTAKATARNTILAHATSRYYNAAAIGSGYRGIIRTVAPAKALQKVKRYLRRECRKPPDMKIRDYFTLINFINNEEIPYLPPFRGNNQKITPDELIDIITFGVPKSWIKEMDRQGKDPDEMSPRELVEFLEQIELSEDFDGVKVISEQQKKKAKGKKSSSDGNDGAKCCMIHGKGNHSTDECFKVKQKLGLDSDKSNKTWSRKASEAKDKASKDLKAFVQKTVRQEVNAIAKKRKGDMNALEEESDYEDVDLSQFDLDDLASGVEEMDTSDKEDGQLSDDESA